MARTPCQLVEKLGQDAPPVLLFHEVSGGGRTDFVDTYDAATGGQDPGRYDHCFVELERMADVAIKDLEGLLDKHEDAAEEGERGSARQEGEVRPINRAASVFRLLLRFAFGSLSCVFFLMPRETTAWRRRCDR